MESLRVCDFKPINLLHGILKIITKTLTIRLSRFADLLVDDSQSTFIRGRQIIDCYLTTMESISYCYKPKQKGLVLKIDFEKASDKVIGPSSSPY